ncbi:hypothetical protein HUG17_4081 [Dermatophagoides farinae]|uniref:Uncharacterized protein n=1 Tax=Dermatophagoides farinae TaxID=6954 RepID=A0A9D4NX81_DERFA|nr:putative uncharacterized protein DDB_G0271606 [Dermatophagoides farinae]KAH7640048.1 hypothetical protein HUG17_4081 [Dermatophagoides farinae]
MNPSGNEFTLRVAICDLVERLKRMQHKCSYLEECRNQLVKEVIRLRLQNEWLARQIGNDSPEISSLPPPPPPPTQSQQQQNLQICFSCNQQSANNNNNNNLVNHNAHCQHHHQQQQQQMINGHQKSNRLNDDDDDEEEEESPMTNRSATAKDDSSIHLINILNEFERNDNSEESNRQDSIRQLTIQMLKDLDAEMKTGKLKMELINFVRNNIENSSSSNDDGDELIKFDNHQMEMDGKQQQQQQQQQPMINQTNQSNDYEAFNNNSDYYTNSHNINVQQQQQQQRAITMAKIIERSTNDVDVDEEKLNKLQPSSQRQTISRRQDAENRNFLNSATATTTAAAAAATATATTTSIFNSIDLVTQENQLINIIKIIRNDIKYLHQGVLASTDKLNRLKTRQLRHFFQKQINLEQQQHQQQQSGTTSTNK